MLCYDCLSHLLTRACWVLHVHLVSLLYYRNVSVTQLTLMVFLLLAIQRALNFIKMMQTKTHHLDILFNQIQ